MKNRLLKFFLVGSGGFIIDYSIFHTLVYSMPDYLARIISVFFAVLFTWLLNRRYTFNFKEKNIFKEFIKYFLSSKFSIGVNYIVFILVLNMYSLSYLNCYIIATVASSITNYLLYRSI